VPIKILRAEGNIVTLQEGLHLTKKYIGRANQRQARHGACIEQPPHQRCNTGSRTIHFPVTGNQQISHCLPPRAAAKHNDFNFNIQRFDSAPFDYQCMLSLSVNALPFELMLRLLALRFC
jgi:hypothetical protein